jgi:S-DNA-T family DNA segregation ATPase FtsK/SpoIIIE
MPRKSQSAQKGMLGKITDLIAQGTGKGAEKGMDKLFNEVSKPVVEATGTICARFVDIVTGSNSSGSSTSKTRQPASIAVNEPEEKRFSFSPRGNYHWTLPELGILSKGEEVAVPSEEDDEKHTEKGLAIQDVYKSHGINLEYFRYRQCQTFDRYCFNYDEGDRLNKIPSYEKNIMGRLGAEHVIIHAPVRGKKFIGVDIPNECRPMVTTGDLLRSDEWGNSKAKIPLALGKDPEGKPIIRDLTAMPHLLIAGETGSGKSVCLHNLIASLLYKFFPRELRLVMIDPKRAEMKCYNRLENIFLEDKVINTPAAAINALRQIKFEMERRYDSYAGNEVNIEGHNEAVRRRRGISLPYIVVIIDELESLIKHTSHKKEREELMIGIQNLTSMGRAAGVHCILATQRPTAKTISGDLKGNIPARIACKVSARINSEVILDQAGAEKLKGKGDMLYLDDSSATLNAQGGYINPNETEALINSWINGASVAPTRRIPLQAAQAEETRVSARSGCRE